MKRKEAEAVSSLLVSTILTTYLSGFYMLIKSLFRNIFFTNQIVSLCDTEMYEAFKDKVHDIRRVKKLVAHTNKDCWLIFVSSENK